jgi:hypothetical protein
VGSLVNREWLGAGRANRRAEWAACEGSAAGSRDQNREQRVEAKKGRRLGGGDWPVPSQPASRLGQEQ